MAHEWRGRLGLRQEAQALHHSQVWKRISVGCAILQWTVHHPGEDCLAAPELDSGGTWRVSMAQVCHCHDLLRAILGPLALRYHIDTLFRFIRTATTITGYPAAASHFSAMTSATASIASECVRLAFADRLCSRSQFRACPSAGSTIVVRRRRECLYRRRRLC